MPTKKEKPYPAEFTLDYQPFNRVTFIKKGAPKTSTPYVYDGRGYKFAKYPETGELVGEPKENLRSAHILFGMTEDTGYKRWFAFYSADCYDPPVYLVNADNESEAHDAFTEDFEALIKVDDVEHEREVEGKELAKKDGQEWDKLSEDAKQAYKQQAEDAKFDYGVWSCNGRGTIVFTENIQMFELELVSAEVRKVVK